MIACLRSPAGSLFARPWFDGAALLLLSGWFFPLSRLWAAARAAEGSVERYCAEVGISPSLRSGRALERRLGRFERVRAQVAESERAWEDAFFGPAVPSPAALLEAERARLSNRHAYNVLRRSFAPFAAWGRAAPFRWRIPEPAEVEALYGGFLAEPARAFALPDPMPAVEASHAFPAAPGRRDYWIRFPSPQPAGRRIHRPGVRTRRRRDRRHCSSATSSASSSTIGAAWRTRPRALSRWACGWCARKGPGPAAGAFPAATEASSSWRRRPAARRPLHRRRARMGVLMTGAGAGRGPVAIGGSLGAMTAQIVSDRARGWPERLRPDAMFLVTHCGRIEEAMQGSLARAWGIAGATMAHGWTPELAGRFMPLLDPVDETSVAPENIVSVLGAYDRVTPYGGARALIDRWGVPRENRFIWRRGHFTVPLTMLRNPAPLVRFREVLAGLA